MENQQINRVNVEEGEKHEGKFRKMKREKAQQRNSTAQLFFYLFFYLHTTLQKKFYSNILPKALLQNTVNKSTLLARASKN